MVLYQELEVKRTMTSMVSMGGPTFSWASNPNAVGTNKKVMFVKTAHRRWSYVTIVIIMITLGPRDIASMFSLYFMLLLYPSYIRLGMYNRLCIIYSVTMFGKFHEYVYMTLELVIHLPIWLFIVRGCLNQFQPGDELLVGSFTCTRKIMLGWDFWSTFGS